MALLSLILASAADTQPPAPPPPPVVMGGGTYSSEPITEPPDKTIIGIEQLRAAYPNKFPDGTAQEPTVEVADKRCVQTGVRHFACEYRFRIKSHGETNFGPWTDRKKVFSKHGPDWLQLNGEGYCRSLDQRRLPPDCFPPQGIGPERQ